MLFRSRSDTVLTRFRSTLTTPWPCRSASERSGERDEGGRHGEEAALTITVSPHWMMEGQTFRDYAASKDATHTLSTGVWSRCHAAPCCTTGTRRCCTRSGRGRAASRSDMSRRWPSRRHRWVEGRRADLEAPTLVGRGIEPRRSVTT